MCGGFYRNLAHIEAQKLRNLIRAVHPKFRPSLAGLPAGLASKLQAVYDAVDGYADREKLWYGVCRAVSPAALPLTWEEYQAARVVPAKP